MNDLFKLFAFLAVLLQLLIVSGVVLRVMLTRHPPGSSFAWIILTLILPYVGFLLYLSFGEKPLGRLRIRKLRKSFSKWKRKFIFDERTPTFQDSPFRKHYEIIRLATNLSSLPFTHAANISLKKNSSATFASILKDIETSQNSIDMEFYIWNEDGIVKDVISKLIDAAHRGVSIRILLDDFGSRNFLKSHTCKLMRDSGIQIQAALPLHFVNFIGIQRTDIRLHRKTIIIDDKIAYTGSLNMIDPLAYKKSNRIGAWVDAMVRLEGRAVLALQAVWEFDWSLQGKTPDVKSLARLATQPENRFGNVAVIPSDPSDPFNQNQLLLIEAIHQAKKSIVITTPYFVPSEAVVVALINAAKKGIKVRLIIPRKSDSSMVGHASRRYFDDLLLNHIEILVYENGLLHTKSILIDDEFALFGTLNIDVRSMHLNFELMLLVFENEFISALRELHIEYAQCSKKISIRSWRARPFYLRCIEGACYLVSPLL